MPWKETNTVDQRTEFAKRAMREEISFTALCREFGISTKTGYKWKQRFLQQGTSGLTDRSRRPHDSPNRISAMQTCDILCIKTANPRYGPKKVHEIYNSKQPAGRQVSLNTVKRLLERTGLVEKKPRRLKADHCGRISLPITADGPNVVWTVDFKGHW